MGSASSKASRAAGAASRQYPKRTPATTTTPSTNAPAQRPPPAPHHEPGPTARPQARASATRDEAINLDASDPDFARSLRSIGPVQPNPTLSPTSAFPQPNNNQQSAHAVAAAQRRARSGAGGPEARTNPAIAVLDARARLQDQAEAEFQEAGRRGHAGREFLDVYDIRKVLQLRDAAGKGTEEIERQLGLKGGVVERLGAKGVFGMATETGRGRKDVDIV